MSEEEQSKQKKDSVFHCPVMNNETLSMRPKEREREFGEADLMTKLVTDYIHMSACHKDRGYLWMAPGATVPCVRLSQTDGLTRSHWKLGSVY